MEQPSSESSSITGRSSGGSERRGPGLSTLALRNTRNTVLDRETAPAFWLVESLFLMLATVAQTNNRFSMMEQVMGGGLGPPTHRHPANIEGFYVLEGTCIFHVDGKKLRAGPGTLFHLPRMIPHTFTVESAETRVLNFYAPGGSELIMMGLGRPASERRRPTMEESAPPKNQEQTSLLQTLFGTEGVTAMPFSVPSTEALLVTEPGTVRFGKIYLSNATDTAADIAFGMSWRRLASGSDTETNYDLFEVAAETGAGMPTRVATYDEAIYLVEGRATLVSDGQTSKLRAGAFAYMPAGSIFSWHAEQQAKLLVFHVPAGFDHALAEGGGEDNLTRGYLEASGTRFL